MVINTRNEIGETSSNPRRGCVDCYFMEDFHKNVMLSDESVKGAAITFVVYLYLRFLYSCFLVLFVCFLPTIFSKYSGQIKIICTCVVWFQLTVPYTNNLKL